MESTTFQTIQQYFAVWWDRFLVPIDDPGSRLFHLNLVFTLGFIALWYLFSPSKKTTFWKLIFRKKYWWNRSTKVDFTFYFLNSLLKIFLFFPLLDFGFFFSQKTARLLLELRGDFLNLEATGFNLFCFGLFAFVFDDFLRFFHHWLMHKIPLLWRFHQTHHSAKILTPISLYRTHPFESAMATLRNSFSLGVSTGLFLFIFSGSFNVFTFFGVNIFGFIFNLFASNLRHSHIDLSFGWFEAIFISPKQHQIHHSTNPLHFEKNFGVSLTIWDRLLGSYLPSQAITGKLRFGLANGAAGKWKRWLIG